MRVVRGFVVLFVKKNTLSHEPIGIAIQANDFLFLNLLQNFITALVNSGDLRKLSDRWFEDGAWISQLPM
jgi:polar amino acid transport system substrate-binding protein